MNTKIKMWVGYICSILCILLMVSMHKHVPTAATAIILSAIFFWVGQYYNSKIPKICKAKPIEDVFDLHFMSQIGYTIIKDDAYGEAHSQRIIGKTIIYWNRKGPKFDYFGDPLEPGAIYLGIKEDGGTRTVFHGYIYSREELLLILKRIL